MTTKILEQKITELRHTLAWMDLVMANINECVLVLDSNWRVIFVNSFFAEILQQDRVLLIGKYFWELPPFHETTERVKDNKLQLKDVATFDGIFSVQTKHITRRISFEGKYVEPLDQAVCIISDVSIELTATEALLALQTEIDRLTHELSIIDRRTNGSLV